MIDIVKAVQEADPSLGTYVIVLRGDSRALDGPERLNPEAQGWLAVNTPGGRLARVKIRLAPYPGAAPAERDVTVMAFAEARELAAFATAWTGDVLPDEPEESVSG
ncbi:hypothetical protein SAMN05216360_11298 [Methylobacterium phyllostachyos]|uniref:Uncharacterized protein n=1 Tax=Methylobacterium phyllostachyos TaxID=582672 RepID=A0A1H0F2G5_9HYPH|nr:hypothetical protein [Methylobacterium phyllostachyos]SDN88857.1 hypothetical protein SAMN05216360_11298 [Methylobacterium phyllostachyos]